MHHSCLWKPMILCLAKKWLWKKLRLEHSSSLLFCTGHEKTPRESHQFSQRLPLWVLKSVADQSKLRLRWSFFPTHHSPVLYINHTFGIWITKVRGVWWTIMQHCFIDGIRGLVWENACWKARNTLLYLSHENQTKPQSLINSYKIVKGSGGMW